MLQRLLRGVFNHMTRGVWREFEDACRDPAAAQERRLFEILRRNEETVFGRERSFSKIKSVGEYRAAVPVSDFSAFEPYIARMRRGEPRVLTADAPEMFATTSGTTDRPKFIPVTPSFYTEFYNTQKVWSRINLNAHPGILRGRFLTMVSPCEEGRTEGGIPYGAMSGRNYRNHMTIPVQKNFMAIPYSVFCIRDFEAKYYTILRLAVQERITLISMLNPSTIVLLARKLGERAEELIRDLHDGGIRVEKELPPETLAEIRPRLKADPRRAGRMRAAAEREGELLPRDAWPDLALITTWTGGSSNFYLKRFARLFGDVPLRDFGYNASEGYFSIPLRATSTAAPEDTGGVFAASGHFVEFIPHPGGGEPLLCGQLREGGEYRVILTASNGLYRYDINDVVEVRGFEGGVPVIAFKHRSNGVVSVTGEKVTESQVTIAFQKVRDRLRLDVEDFIAWVECAAAPSYVIAAEPAADGRSPRPDSLAAEFDGELKRANIEYRAKRDSGRLGAPRALLLKPGSMAHYRQTRVREGGHDAQVKILHLVHDCSMLNDFEAGGDSESETRITPGSNPT